MPSPVSCADGSDGSKINVHMIGDAVKKFCVLLMFAVLLLTGCADSLPKISRTTTTHYPDGRIVQVQEENAVPDAMSDAEAVARGKCIDYVSAREVERLRGMTADQKFATQAMDALERAYGAKQSVSDICSSGANFYDYMIADTEAANKTRQEGLRTLKVFGFVGGGVLALDKLAGSIGDRVGGDQISSGRDTKLAGDNLDDASSSADVVNDINLIGGEDNQNGDRDDNSDNSEVADEVVE